MTKNSQKKSEVRDQAWLEKRVHERGLLVHSATDALRLLQREVKRMNLHPESNFLHLYTQFKSMLSRYSTLEAELIVHLLHMVGDLNRFIDEVQEKQDKRLIEIAESIEKQKLENDRVLKENREFLKTFYSWQWYLQGMIRCIFKHKKK